MKIGNLDWNNPEDRKKILIVGGIAVGVGLLLLLTSKDKGEAPDASGYSPETLAALEQQSSAISGLREETAQQLEEFAKYVNEQMLASEQAMESLAQQTNDALNQMGQGVNDALNQFAAMLGGGLMYGDAYGPAMGYGTAGGYYSDPLQSNLYSTLEEPVSLVSRLFGQPKTRPDGLVGSPLSDARSHPARSNQLQGSAAQTSFGQPKTRPDARTHPARSNQLQGSAALTSLGRSIMSAIQPVTTRRTTTPAFGQTTTAKSVTVSVGGPTVSLPTVSRSQSVAFGQTPIAAPKITVTTPASAAKSVGAPAPAPGMAAKTVTAAPTTPAVTTRRTTTPAFGQTTTAPKTTVAPKVTTRQGHTRTA